MQSLFLSALLLVRPAPLLADTPVPEPSTLALMSTGLIGAFCTLRRRFLN